MTDIKHQLRAYFDEVDPPFDVADLMREPRPEVAPTRSPVRNGLVVAAAAAVVVVLVVGLPLLLSGGQRDPAAEPTVTTVQPMTTDLLSCLPLDPAGWARSEPLPAMAAAPQLPDAALTAAGGTAVAVGMDMNRNVEAYWSHDGVEWASAEGFPEAKVVGESPPAVAGGAAGFVAVVVPDIYPGLAPLDHPDTPPIVAFSEDGITWERLDPETVPHGVLWLSDVYAGSAGFLITGTINTGSTGSGFGAFVWASPDGRSWSVADYPVDSWGYPAVFAIDTGWAAHTSTGTYRKPTEIWRSTDGVDWYERATQNAPPDSVLAVAFKASPTAVHGDTWVIAGLQRVWTSTDEGATWEDHAIGGDRPTSDTRDIAATPVGLLLTGRTGLHYSSDGTTWQHCAISGWSRDVSHFTEIAMLGDTLIVLDSATGRFHTWNDPNAPNTNIPTEGGRP